MHTRDEKDPIDWYLEDADDRLASPGRAALSARARASKDRGL